MNVADSEWHYLATTYDGNKCTLYIDGEEDFGRSAGGANGEIGGPADQNDGPLTIGVNAVPAYAFDGIIDEVRLSSIARTQEEIKEAMEKGLKAMAAVSPGRQADSHMGWYKTAIALWQRNILIANQNGGFQMRSSFWFLGSVFCFLLVNLAFLTYADIDGDTVAIWLFDEGSGNTARDSSGNGHDGTLVGDPGWVDTQNGKGLDFGGNAANYVEVPDADDLDLDEWTVEGWFLVRSVVGGWDCAFAKETTNPTNRNYALHIQGGGLGIIHGSISVGNAFGHATFGVANVADSNWHYLTATYDGNKCTLYIDGAEDFGRSAGGDNGVIGGPPDHNDGFLSIGANAAAAYAFDGIIDMIRLSSRARTQAEIEQAMEGITVVSPGAKLATTWSGIKQQ